MGLDNLEKGETPEVCVSRANPANAMFAHQDRRMRVVKEIAREPGKLGDDLRGDGCVPFSRHKGIAGICAPAKRELRYPHITIGGGFA